VGGGCVGFVANSGQGGRKVFARREPSSDWGMRCKRKKKKSIDKGQQSQGNGDFARNHDF